MASIVVYRKIKPAELKKMAKEAIKGVTVWFEKNPKRRVCRATLWYNTPVKVPRGKVKETIDAVVAETLKNDPTWKEGKK